MYKCLRFTKHVRDLRQPPDVLLGKLKMDGHLVRATPGPDRPRDLPSSPSTSPPGAADVSPFSPAWIFERSARVSHACRYPTSSSSSKSTSCPDDVPTRRRRALSLPLPLSLPLSLSLSARSASLSPPTALESVLPKERW